MHLVQFNILYKTKYKASIGGVGILWSVLFLKILSICTLDFCLRWRGRWQLSLPHYKTSTFSATLLFLLFSSLLIFSKWLLLILSCLKCSALQFVFSFTFQSWCILHYSLSFKWKSFVHVINQTRDYI